MYLNLGRYRRSSIPGTSGYCFICRPQHYDELSVTGVGRIFCLTDLKLGLQGSLHEKKPQMWTHLLPSLQDGTPGENRSNQVSRISNLVPNCCAKRCPKIHPSKDHQNSYQSCSWQWSSPWLLSFHCCCCLDQTPAWRRVSDCLPSVDASTISFSLFSWPRWFPVSNPLKCLPVSLLVSLRSLRLALAHFGQIPFVPLRITWD